MSMDAYRRLPLKTRIINGSLFFALGLASVGIGFMVYWSLTGKDVLTVTNAPLPVKPKVVKSEERIVLDVSFCKQVNAPGRVIRRLVSDRTELLAPTVNESVGAGCYEHLPVPIPIPPQTPPGRYHVNYRITYDTNPLHRGIVEEFNSQEFDVVE
jgi:hypothetical protein